MTRSEWAPPPVQQPGSWLPSAYSAPTATSGLAITSLVLGIVWLFWLGSILAIVFAFIALHRIRRAHGALRGGGLAIGGMVLGWVGIATLVGTIVLFGAVGRDPSAPRKVGHLPPAPSTPSSPISSGTFAVGDVIQDGGWRLVVRSVQNPSGSPAPFLTAPPGDHYLAADVEATNATGKPQAFLVLTIALEDPVGHQFYPDPSSTLASPSGGVDPGVSINGSVVFDVPDSASNLVLVFWPDPIAGKARIALP